MREVLVEGSNLGPSIVFLSKSSIFASEETEKVYDADCTYSSQWRGLLPFYSCREDGVELPNQWESCREVHRLLSDRCQYFRWRDSGRSECCQIRKMKVILDTNIWISFLLGKRLTILREIIEMDQWFKTWMTENKQSNRKIGRQTNFCTFYHITTLSTMSCCSDAVLRR